MKISIIGHGHLAYVTAACMEQFHKVNVDDDKIGDSEIVWVCYDTPVDSDGKPSSQVIIDRLDKILPNASVGTIVLISSQVPVGTCTLIQEKYLGSLSIACSPENLRRGKAVNDFMNPERIIVGTDGLQKVKEKIEELFAPLKKPIFWTSVESAEMVKHALNSFLALSIAFINEIDKVAKAAGADSADVAYGLQSDKRVGFLSYLKPGGPYTNDTLGREIYTLIELDKKFNLGLNLIPAIKKSNDAHINNRK
jgi:UDPglucose 6-dehydrogenase